MQDCFRKYPEVYGAELDDDDDDGEGQGEDGDAIEKATEAGSPSMLAPTPSTSQASSPPTTSLAGGKGEKVPLVNSGYTPAPDEGEVGKRKRAREASKQTKDVKALDESSSLAPKTAHDEPRGEK